MKLFRILLTLIILSPAQWAMAQSTITVNPNGSADYTTIQGALDQINNSNISNDVIIKIAKGTYDEKLNLLRVNGQYKITLESQTGKAEDVILTNSNIANVFDYTLSIRVVHKVEIKNLTFRGTADETQSFVALGDSTGSVLFDQLIFEKASNVSEDMYAFAGYIDIINFNYGGSCEKLTISGCTLDEVPVSMSDIYGYRIHQLIFTENAINDAQNVSWYGYDLTIEKSTFTKSNIGIISAKTFRIESNNIYYDNSQDILSINRNGDTMGLGYITNNMINHDGYSSGIAMIANSNNIHIANNSLKVKDDACIFFNVDIDSVNVYNNVMYSEEEAYGLQFFDSVTYKLNTFNCDHNSYYFPNAKGIWFREDFNLFVYEYSSFNEVKSKHGFESNGLNIDPLFISETDLHASNAGLKDAGKVLPYISVDIDGEIRKNKPDIGADEIQGNINLVVDRIFNLQGTLEAGKKIQLEYEVRNSGTLDINHVWTDKIYISSDAKLDGNDLLLKNLEIKLNLGAGKLYKRQESIALPYIPGGNYYFLIKTNAEEEDFESSLSDNVKASSQLTFNSAKLSDLQVTDVVTPSSQFSGKSFQLEWTVKNTGTSATPGTWVDAIYAANSLSVLNNPKNLTNDSLLVVKRSAPRSLNPGESYTNTWDIHLPLRYSGKIYYRVQSNANAAFFEVDTTYSDNGKNSAAVNVTQSPLPDLIMTGLNTPNTTFSGEKVGINWTVRNQGQQKTFRTNRQIFEENWLNRANYNYWTDRVYLSRKPFYDEEEPSQRLIATYYRPNEELDVNTAYTHTDTILFDNCDYGKYYIIGVANQDAYTYELTYSNNFGPLDSINVIIDPVPDLKPTKLTVLNQPSSGKTIAVDYTVLNDGFSTKPAIRSNDHFYISVLDTLNLSESIYLGYASHYDTLAVNNSYNDQVEFNIPFDVFGDYYLYCVADFNDQICEANLNNNNTFRTVQKIKIDLSPQPDLVPNFFVAPDTVVAGNSYTLITQTTNNGKMAATEGNWIDQIKMGKTVLNTSFYRSTLGIDNSYWDTISITIPIGLTEGFHSIQLYTDAHGDVFEYGLETNNIITKSLYVKRNSNNVPDLEISQLKVATSGAITAGDKIEIEYQLKNLSKSTHVNGWEDEIRIIDASAKVVYFSKLKHIGGLANLESKTFTKSIQIPHHLSGNYSLEYTVNGNPSFMEYRVDNNKDKVSQSIATYIPPDIEITNISFNECCQMFALQNEEYLVELTNNGPGNIEGQTIGIRVYLSKDQFGNGTSSVVYKEVVTTIASGKSKIIKIPVKWDYSAEGDYYIMAQADEKNAVFEGENEDNNLYVSGYTINVDNEPISFFPSQINILTSTNPFSDFMRVEYTVEKGNAKALKRHIDDRLILSMDKTLSADDLQFGFTNPKLRDLAQNTTSYTDEIIGTVPNYIQPGWYFVGVNIDGLNTVLELDETNNILFSSDSFYIDQTIPLTLDNGKDFSFYEGTVNGEEYFNLNRPAKKGMIVQLDFENDQVSSELYHRIGQIPTDAMYDNKYNDPYLADQEFLVPVTDTATQDFLYIKANKVPWVNSDPADFSCFLGYASSGGGISVIRPMSCNLPDTVAYNILAKSAEYSIHKISPDSGSFHGAISLLVEGFDFNDSTTFYLTNGTDTLFPMQQERISSTEFALHIDLRESVADQYDIVAVQKNNETTKLVDGFTVFEGASEEPFVSVHLNSAPRVLVNQNAQFTVDFGNRGFSDGHDYWLWVAFANESFDPSKMNTSYIGSSEEEMYDLLEEHPNPPNDSAFVDVDGIRYYLYWVPVLPARGQTTFTYNFSNNDEELVLVQAELIPNEYSEYTASQYPPYFDRSTSYYQLMDIAQQIETGKGSNKSGFDCDNIDIQNVEREIIKQTWAVGQNVHGGAKTFAGVNGISGAIKKAFKTKLVDPAKDALDPKKALENSKKAAKDKENLKKLIDFNKPMKDRFSDYAKSVFDAGNPVENLKKITKPDDPPFKDLIDNTFKCIDFDRVEKKINDCTFEKSVSKIEQKAYGISAGYKRVVLDKCREEYGLEPRKKDEDNFVVKFVKSLDPNEIVGPEGVTDARLINKDETLQYTIHFENMATAGAPARYVAINNPLPEGLRAQSFRLTSYGFGDTTLFIQPTNAINTTIALGKKYNHQNLNLVAGIDVINNTAFWRFTTIDPNTGNMTVSPFDGFLPPNDSTQIGQGFVTYEIKLEPDVVNGTEILNEADIIFDQNEIIPTNVWSNTVASSNAQSKVLDLPAESEKSFTVRWEGESNAAGTGIESISVYVSKDNGPYQLWLTNDQSGAADFVGIPGSTYQFYSILKTLDGAEEYTPAQADATTKVKDDNISTPVFTTDNGKELAKVYPNPSSGKFKVEHSGTAQLKIRVVNINGKVITAGNTPDNHFILNLSDQPKGVYILTLSDGENVQHLRLMVR